MVTRASDYVFVSPSSLKRVKVDGRVFPLRAERRVPRMEDVVYLAEAAAERAKDIDGPLPQAGSVEVGIARVGDRLPMHDPECFVDRTLLASESFTYSETHPVQDNPFGDADAVGQGIARIAQYNALEGLRRKRPWFYGWRHELLVERVFAMSDGASVMVGGTYPWVESSRIGISRSEYPFLVGLDRNESTESDPSYFARLGVLGRMNSVSIQSPGGNSSETESFTLSHARMSVRICGRHRKAKSVWAVLRFHAVGTGGESVMTRKVQMTLRARPCEQFVTRIDALDDALETARKEKDEAVAEAERRLRQQLEAELAVIDAELRGLLDECLDEHLERVGLARARFVTDAGRFAVMYNSATTDRGRAEAMTEINALREQLDRELTALHDLLMDEEKVAEAHADSMRRQARESHESRVASATAGIIAQWDAAVARHASDVQAVQAEAAQYTADQETAARAAYDKVLDGITDDPDNRLHAQAEADYRRAVSDIETLDMMHREEWTADLSQFSLFGRDLFSNPRTERIGDDTITTTEYLAFAPSVVAMFVELDLRTVTGASHPDYEALDMDE